MGNENTIMVPITLLAIWEKVTGEMQLFQQNWGFPGTRRMVRASTSLPRSLVSVDRDSPNCVAVLCAGVAGSSQYWMPWKSWPQAFSCFDAFKSDIFDIFNILKNYSGIAVSNNCKADFGPERPVEQYIIHISSYLARLFMSETEAIIE